MSERMSFDITAQDSASAEFLQVAAAAERLEEKLKRLDKMKVEPKIALDTKKAESDLKSLETRLKALKNANARADVDTGKARRDVDALAKALRSLRNAAVNVDVDDRGAIAKLELLASLASILDGTRVEIKVDVDDQGAIAKLQSLDVLARVLSGTRVDIQADVDTAGALAQLAALKAAIRDVAGRYTARLDVDNVGFNRGIGDSSGRMKQWQAIALAIFTTAPALAGMIGSTTGAVLSLGAALLQTGPIAVAGLGMLGGVLATVEMGTQGLGLAMGALAEGDMKKFKQALQSMSPEAQKFTLVLKDLFTTLQDGRLGVQDQLFAGLSKSLRQLGAVEVPMLIRGMGGVAQELNLAAKEVMNYVGSAEGIARQNSMWTSTRMVVANLRPAFTDLTAAMFDIGEVGSRVLADVTSGAGGATQRFREFIAAARESGQLEQWMRAGVTTLGQLGSIAQNVGGILGGMWQAAKAAGADFLAQLDRNTAELNEFIHLADTQSGLVTFFAQSRQAMDLLYSGLQDLTQGFLKMMGVWADTGSMVAFSGALGQIMSTIGGLLPSLGELSGHTLAALANGFSLAASTIGVLVGGLLNLANSMGPIVPTILAMVVAFKLLGGASAAMMALGAATAASAAKWGLYATAVTGSMAAGAAANTAVTRLGGTLSALGRALPLIGVAFIGLGAAADEFGSKADSLAQRVVGGSLSIQQAVQQEVAQLDRANNSFGGNVSAKTLYSEASKNVAAAVQAELAAMTPMARLQAEVAMTQANLNDAVVKFGPASREAAAAADANTQAKQRLKVAEDGVAVAMKSTSQAMAEQIQAAQNLLGSMLSVEDAVNRAATAEKAANDAIAQHGANSAEAQAAVNDYAQAADQAAQAIGKQAEVTAQLNGVQNPAAEGTKAYGAALLQMAANANGPARDGLMNYLGSLNQTQLSAMSAAAETANLSTKVIQLPNGKTIKVAVDPETGKILTTQQLIDQLAKPVNIKVGADVMPAQQAFQSVLTAVQQGQATVRINGEPMPALDALRLVGAQAGLTNAEVQIQGRTVNAMEALNAFITSVQTGNPMVNIGGQDFDARAVFGALKGFIETTPMKGTIDADPQPAMDSAARARMVAEQPALMGITGVDNTGPAVGAARSNAAQGGNFPVKGQDAAAPTIGAVRGNAAQGGNFPVKGQDNAAPVIGGARSNAGQGANMPIRGQDFVTPLANWLQRTGTKIINIIANYIGFGGAEGGVLMPMARGGVVAQRGYASGGVEADVPGKTFQGHRLTPMAKRAAVVQPNTWRVIGDNMSVPEVFIPLNGSKASLAYTRVAAHQQGYGLTPLRGGGKTASGAKMSAFAGGGMAASSPVAAMASQLWAGYSSHRTQVGGWGMDLGPLVAELRGVRAAVLATIPDNAAVVAAVGRVERALTARSNVAATAQGRRVDGELSRI